MPSDRTFVTELATGLGTLGDDDMCLALGRRPAEMANLEVGDWERLHSLWESGAYSGDFEAGFANGRAFLEAPDALRGRRPRMVEWTGGRRPPGDEIVPSDLRIDHVYLVSCKYLSRILHNPSPSRLVDALLTQAAVDDGRDWYQRVAQAEYQQLYEECTRALGHRSFPALASELTVEQRRVLSRDLRGGWPAGAAHLYSRLCGVVSDATARSWNGRIGERGAESMLWRLLRIGSAPYFILGTSRAGSVRLRIDSPWDWRQANRLRRFEVVAQQGGQPRVGWCAIYEERRTSEERAVRGHVEIRWSHGRFAQPPEAKVYLDSAHEDVPGYHLLAPSPAPLAEKVADVAGEDRG
ncbi:MAG: hypothetical protein ACRDV4_03795, partial [Acidimicrobiales bacterium]